MTITPELAYLDAYRGGERARITLPAEAYRSPRVFELETERLFRHAWVLAGRAPELGVGDYVTLAVAGEPVVVTRDEEGTLHALSAVCRHRFMPLVEDAGGHLRRFECGYHRWIYRLDGTLAGAPHMKGNPAFDPAACALPRFGVEQWEGFVFVNLDPAAPSLRAQLRALEPRLAGHRLADAVQIATYDRVWQANWKIIVENVSEAYHHAGLHPTTVEPVAPARLAEERCDTVGRHVVTFAAPLAPGVQPPVSEHTADRSALINFYNILPALQIFTYGEVAVWARFLPVDPERTRVTSGVLLPADAGEPSERDRMGKLYGDFITEINTEDQAGVEAVQRGTHSRHARRGHLSPKEPAVAAFYDYLAAALADA